MKIQAFLLLLATLAIAVHAQNAQDIVSDQVRHVQLWGFSILERMRCKPESDVCITDLFIKRTDGSEQALVAGFVGEFIILPRSHRILSCEYNGILDTEAPVLIDLSGGKTDLALHPSFLRVCAATGSGEEVLLVYNMVKGDHIYNLVRVFDASGKLLLETELDNAGSVEFTVSGKRFVAEVPSPEFPG